MKKLDRPAARESVVDVTVDRDECNRPDTTYEGLAALRPVLMGGMQLKEGKTVTAGNSSQFSEARRPAC